MNRNINEKPSFPESVSYYLNQGRGALVVGGIAGTVVSALSLAFHFPGW